MSQLIVSGNDYTFDLGLTAPEGGPFELAGSSLVLVISTPGGTASLTQTLVVDIFGTATTADGLDLGTNTATEAIVTQTLTATQTAALPTGLLTWVATLTDSSGKVDTPLRGEYRVVGATYLDAALTRREIRRRVADRLGDLTILEATAASASDTTFTDALNISGAADNLTGRQFSVATGVNTGHIARIVSSSESTNSITFTPAADSIFAVGDELEVVNTRSRGWSIAEYNRAINNAISDAYPLGVASLTASIPDAFSRDSPIVTIPEVLDEISEVAWQDPDTLAWIPLRPGAFYGWAVDPANATLTVTGWPSDLADTRALRLSGYGRHPTLLTDDDVTALHVEWIVARACYHLALAGADREGARGNTILVYQQEADRARIRIATLRRPGTVQVRQ